jgi:very-short-patch-repair endonuclease
MELGDLISAAAPGDVRLVTCSNVPDTLARLEVDACTAGLQQRVAVCIWDELPDLPTLIADVLERLAAAALQLWPHWYGVDLDPAADATLSDWRSAIERAALADGVSLPRLLPTWLKDAAGLCCAGRPPLPCGYSNAAQLAQLALAVAPDDLVFVLCVATPTPRRDTLFGLAKAAEWLAIDSGASVHVLVSNELTGVTELDHINYRSVRLPDDPPMPLPSDLPAMVNPPDQPPSDSPVMVQPLLVEEKTRFVVLPVEGRPHPNSPGEQLLARRLQDDPRLAGLFAPNQIIATVRRHRLMVDLLWQEGKLVVEIDGYQWHSSKQAFSHDRQRDYELSISGYLTLRLPHHEVIADPDTALEKIADLVAFRRHELSLPSRT